MKRNVDLVRKILLKMDDHQQGYALNDLAVPDFAEEEIGYHFSY